MDGDEKVGMSSEEASTRAVEAFEVVFQNGTNIELDHHLVYHARAYSLFTFTR